MCSGNPFLARALPGRRCRHPGVSATVLACQGLQLEVDPWYQIIDPPVAFILAENGLQMKPVIYLQPYGQEPIRPRHSSPAFRGPGACLRFLSCNRHFRCSPNGERSIHSQSQTQAEARPDACRGRRTRRGSRPHGGAEEEQGSSDDTPPPPKPKKQPTSREYSLHVDVPVVTVDARVVMKDGRPLALPPERCKEHFKVWEDGVEQKIQTRDPE